jgi:hypothetical protein
MTDNGRLVSAGMLFMWNVAEWHLLGSEGNEPVSRELEAEKYLRL